MNTPFREFSDKFFKAIVQTIREPLVVLDESLKVVTANQAFHKKFLPDDPNIIGRSLYHVGNQELDIPELRKLLTESSEVEDYTLVHTFPDQSKRTLLFNARKINDSDEQELILLAFEDVTAETRAKEKLEQFNHELEKQVEQRTRELEKTNQELESFSYSVSHDLRSPLRAITGFSKLLREEAGENLNEEAQRFLGIIDGNAIKMGNLIDDLLAFSRMGRREQNIGRFSMKNLVEEVGQEALRNYDNAENVEFQVQELPAVKADYSMLKIAWENLLNNALKYSQSSKIQKIEVGGYTQEDQNIYWIKDNGSGFDEQYKYKLFEVFQRLHTDEEFSGTGVGLSIVKRVIDRHNGEVWAKSELGQGAVFYFSLPSN